MTLLEASGDDLAHASEWAARHMAALGAKGVPIGQGRTATRGQLHHTLGHLGELLLARDLEVEHGCQPELVKTRAENGYDLLAGGRRIEVKVSQTGQLWEDDGGFSRERFDFAILLLAELPAGLRAAGFIDPDTFADRAETTRSKPPRRWMPWQALGRYEVFVDILFDPELAGAAELNGRPFGG